MPGRACNWAARGAGDADEGSWAEDLDVDGHVWVDKVSAGWDAVTQAQGVPGGGPRSGFQGRGGFQIAMGTALVQANAQRLAGPDLPGGHSRDRVHHLRSGAGHLGQDGDHPPERLAGEAGGLCRQGGRVTGGFDSQNRSEASTGDGGLRQRAAKSPAGPPVGAQAAGGHDERRQVSLRAPGAERPLQADVQHVTQVCAEQPARRFLDQREPAVHPS